MANTLRVSHATGATLYFVIRDESGDVYNGTVFETWSAANWGNYDYPLTEQTSSGVYIGTFPALATGDYAVVIYKQENVPGSPAVGDVIVGTTTIPWDGTTIVGIEDCSDTRCAAAILDNPGNKLATVGSGEVTVNNTSAIATAVWASGTRTLTSFGTLVADVATQVWASVSRTLTAFSFDTNNATLEGRLTAGRATNLDNLDATVSSRAAASDLTTAQATLTKLDDTLEDDAGTYRFTTNALEQAPDSTSDATAANQTAILSAVSALNDLSSADVATAVLGATVDGAIDVEQALKVIFASQHGKMVRTATDPLTFQFYADDDTTVLFTWTIPTTGATRTST